MAGDIYKDSWSMSQERAHMESVVCQRFNFFILFVALLVVGALQTEGIFRLLMLWVGTVISILFAWTVCRADIKLRIIMHDHLYKTNGHPAKIIDDKCGRIPRGRYIIGYIIPIVCCLALMLWSLWVTYSTIAVSVNPQTSTTHSSSSVVSVQAGRFMEFTSNMSIIIASCVAIYGINAWRREFRGKRQIELAEDALALFYEAQDVIQALRSPLGRQGEGTSRKPGENETPKQKAAGDAAYVVFERYQKRQELFNKIYSMRYQFIARFGLEKAKPFEDLRGIVNEIFGAARRLARLWAKDISSLRSDEQAKQHFEKQQKYEDIFWDTYGEDDPINLRLNKVIADMENICRGIIMAEGGAFSIFRRLWSKIGERKRNK